MELLATVHWVAVQEKAVNPEEAVARTYEWSDRKRMFQENHILTAWNALAGKGWLPEQRT